MAKQSTLLGKLPKIIQKLREINGNDLLQIEFRGNRIAISDYGDTLNWDILETIKKLTDKPKITWEVKWSHGNEFLEIILGDE